jgi:site-specific DNA-methyltransferase (adenine-specific)
VTAEVAAKFVGSNGVLIQADCLDLLANMNDDSVDCIFLDPPFNFKKRYNIPNFEDNFDNEFYKGLCRTWILNCVRVLRPGGSIFIYHVPKWLMELGAWLNSLHGLEYRAWIAMKMKNGFPIKGRIHPAHYGLLYYVKACGETTFNVVRERSPKCRKCGELMRDYGGYIDKYAKYQADGDLWVQTSDFWEDTRPASHEKLRGNKINELPLQIPERAILMTTNPGDVVLDCFSGGGSTLHAAELHNRFWIAGDVENPIASLRRIRTFLDFREASAPPSRVLQCFTPEFVKGVLSVEANDDDRPIKHVSPLSDRKAEKFKGKSRVFESAQLKRDLESPAIRKPKRKPIRGVNSLDGKAITPTVEGEKRAKEVHQV